MWEGVKECGVGGVRDTVQTFLTSSDVVVISPPPSSPLPPPPPLLPLPLPPSLVILDAGLSSVGRSAAQFRP